MATKQGHTVMMGLVEAGDDDGSMIHSLGRVNRFLLLWRTTSEEDKKSYHEIIHEDVKEVRACAASLKPSGP